MQWAELCLKNSSRGGCGDGGAGGERDDEAYQQKDTSRRSDDAPGLQRNHVREERAGAQRTPHRAVVIWLHNTHMIGDAVSAFGVILAGAVVVGTGWRIADPIVSFLIAGLILWSSWGILTESVNVLMEGSPRGVDMDTVEKCIGRRAA